MDVEWDDCFPIGSCPPNTQSQSDPFIENWLRDSYHDSGFQSGNSSHETSILPEANDQTTTLFLHDLNLDDGKAVVSRFIQTCPSLRSCPENKILPLLQALHSVLQSDLTVTGRLPVTGRTVTTVTASCWDSCALSISKDYLPPNHESRSPLIDVAFDSGLFHCLVQKLSSLIVCHWGRDTPALTDFTLTCHMLDAVGKLTRFASMNQLNVGVDIIHMMCSLLTLLLPAKSAAFNSPHPPSVSLSPLIYASVLSKALKVVCHMARSPANFQNFREQRGLDILHCWQEELWFKLIKQSKSEQMLSHHPLFTENDRAILEQLRWSVFSLVDLSCTPNNKHYLIHIDADIIWAQIAECSHFHVDQRLRDKCDKGRTELAKDRAQRMPGTAILTGSGPDLTGAGRSNNMVLQLKALSFASRNNVE